MPGYRGKSSIPGPILDAAEKAQTFMYKAHNKHLKSAVNHIEDIFVGSDSEAYHQAQWDKQAHLRVINMTLERVPGDPSVKRLGRLMTRGWRNAAIFSIDHDEYQHLRQYSGMPAVVSVTGLVARVGLPEGSDFGHIDNGARRTAALRLGRNDLVAGLGVWLPEYDQFISAESIKVEETKVPNVLIPAYKDGRYADTPLY
jgi:hypothetical protein